MKSTTWYRPAIHENLLISLAIVLASISLVLNFASDRSFVQAIVDTWLYLSAAIAVKRPKIGLPMVLGGLLSLIFMPAQLRFLGEYALLIPLLSLRRPLRSIHWAVYTLLGISILSVYSLRRFGFSSFVTDFLAFAIMAGVAWLLSSQFRTAEHLQARTREIALQNQRQDIARDLHDTIAHGLVMMIMRCEKAKLKGESRVEDLDYIIETGNDTMAELRSMLRVMRTPHSEAPESAEGKWLLTPLEEVIESCCDNLRKHGFSFSYNTEGDLSRLRRSQVVSLGKIVREATTNIIKHGDPSGPVNFMVSIEPDSADLLFVNTPASRTRTASKNPLGIVGMSERAEAMGGTATSSLTSGHWVTRISVPLGKQVSQA